MRIKRYVGDKTYKEIEQELGWNINYYIPVHFERSGTAGVKIVGNR